MNYTLKKLEPHVDDLNRYADRFAEAMAEEEYSVAIGYLANIKEVAEFLHMHLPKAI